MTKKIIYTIILCILLSFFYFKYTNYNHVPVLGYHSVVSDKDKETIYQDDRYTLSESVFIKHLDYLKQNQFNTISIEQLSEYYNNNTPLPTNPILLTFDDGHIDLATIIDPLLKQYDFVGSAFIIGSKLENNTSTKYDYITIEQMKTTTNLSYYSHTYDLHRYDGNQKILETASIETIIHDHQKMEQYVDNTFVAHPYGVSSSNAIEAYMLQEVQFAFDYNNYTHVKKTSDPYNLPRYMITDLTPLWYIKMIIGTIL